MRLATAATTLQEPEEALHCVAILERHKSHSTAADKEKGQIIGITINSYASHELFVRLPVPFAANVLPLSIQKTGEHTGHR